MTENVRIAHRLAPAPAPPKIAQNTQPRTGKEGNGTHDGKSPWREYFAVFIAVLALLASSYQAYIAQDTEKRQLRAYVGVIPGSIENFGGPLQNLSLTRKNYGNTPAYDVGLGSNGRSVAAVGAAIATLPSNCGSPAFRGMLTMFPSMELPFYIKAGVDNFKDAKDLDAIREGRFQFIYWGTFCYNDAFGRAHTLITVGCIKFQA